MSARSGSKAHPALATGSLEWTETGSDAVMAFYRLLQKERLLVIHNVSAGPQTVSIPASGRFQDLIAGGGFQAEGALHLTLDAYQYMWLKQEN